MVHSWILSNLRRVSEIMTGQTRGRGVKTHEESTTAFVGVDDDFDDSVPRRGEREKMTGNDVEINQRPEQKRKSHNGARKVPKFMQSHSESFEGVQEASDEEQIPDKRDSEDVCK